MIPLTARLLSLIALFEGSARGAINVWDEQYLSVGTLHYAVGQGSGARFLMRVQALDPSGYRRCLGPDFDAATRAGAPALTAFCRAQVWRSGTRWTAAFRQLAALAAYAQADAEGAQPYLQGAVNLAGRYALTSERGLAWAFDRCVQQGPAPRAAVDNLYHTAKLGGVTESARLDLLARGYAKTANPRYVQVVLARSLTVAQGSSARSGYPGRVDLERDFGISLARGWDVQDEVVPGVPRLFLRGLDGRNVEGKVGDVYAGETLTAALLSQIALVYPEGSSGQYGATLRVIRSATDGALLLERA